MKEQSGSRTSSADILACRQGRGRDSTARSSASEHGMKPFVERVLCHLGWSRDKFRGSETLLRVNMPKSSGLPPPQAQGTSEVGQVLWHQHDELHAGRRRDRSLLSDLGTVLGIAEQSGEFHVGAIG